MRQMQTAGTYFLINQFGCHFMIINPMLLGQDCAQSIPFLLCLSFLIYAKLENQPLPSIPQLEYKPSLLTHCSTLQDAFLRSKNKLVRLFDSQKLNKIGSSNYFLDYLMWARLLSKYFDMRRFVKINRQSASHC